jgi:hypothetical protein
MQAPTASRRSLDSLRTLNRRAREQAFGLEDLDWSHAVDRGKPWEPEGLGALWFLPSFASLSPAERLRCNQLHALGVCEQFIWFERQLIRAIGNLLRAGGLPGPLAEALGHFAAEERKHIAMFWRLLERSEPAWYGTRASRLFHAGAAQQFAMDRVTASPRTLLAWVWLAILVEERTLFFSREHLRAARTAPASIDALHAQVHEFHLRDEARHYHLDQHLLTWLYDPQPRWKKALAAAMFRRMMRAYVAASRTATRILAQLAREFPGMHGTRLGRLRDELSRVARDESYHRRLFSRAALPHTFSLLAEYREHERLWELFPIARRELT